MKGDKTTMLALTAAVVILAIVGIKSFLDYKVAELEKIHGPKPAEPAVALAPPNASTPDPAATPEAELTEEEFQSSIDQLPRSVLPPIPDAILAPPAESPPPTTFPGGIDPKKQAELEAEQREIAMYQEKLNQLKSGSQGVLPPAPDLSSGETSNSNPPRPSSMPGSALSSIGEEIPDNAGGPITGAVPSGPTAETGSGFGPTGDLPSSPVQTESEIAAMAEKVKRQPVIAKVVDYDPEWAILVLNGGSENNIKPEMRFAVRRGAEILGFIKVTEVEANQSVAELMSSNKYSPTARKPQRGDDIIAFNLF